MGNTFPYFLKKFSIQFLLLAIALFALHSYLWSHLGNEVQVILPLWQIYIFQALVVFAIFSWIAYKYSKGKKEIFNYFMLGTFVKMILALLFLLPVFLSDLEGKRPDVINFFIPYFIFLAFEVFIITRLITKTEG